MIEFPDTKGKEVGAHAGRIHKCDLGQGAGERYAGGFGHVAQAFQASLDGEGELEDGLAGRFVPARKCTTGIEGFKLRGCHDLWVAVNVSVGATIEPRHLVVQETAVIDCQDESCV